MNATTHVSGYPRIGAKRELKQALEAFWSSKLDAAALDGLAKELRLRHWQEQAGLSFVATNDFSLYDGMLDLACTFGAIPERFGPADSPMTLDISALARQVEGAVEVQLGQSLAEHFERGQLAAGPTS